MNEVQARDEFRKIKPLLEQWGGFIDSYLEDLLKNNFEKERVVKHPERRVKEEESFIRKAFWRETKCDQPMEIRDKVGTRVVLISYEDMDKLLGIIQKETSLFTLQLKKEPDFNNPEVYQAYHLDINPNNKSPVLREYPDLYNILGCEVQIRTAIQDTLAIVSHETVYKGYHSFNPEILNRFNKIVGKFTMSELELLDLEVEMRTETVNITSFISGLKTIGLELFGRNFDADKEDFDLTVSIYQRFNPTERQIDLNDIKKELDSHKDDLNLLFEYSHSYFLNQPISLFVIYLVLKGRRTTLFKEWQYDEEILQDICRYLGYSDGSLSY